MELNKIYHGDCLKVLKTFKDKCIDLTITSPPYDNLRNYEGYTFDFESIAKELYRVTKDGGVIVWIVGDATHRGSETGTSFKQALYFKKIGFNLHDTMIWNKGGFSAVGALINRYCPVFEYMFIFSKDCPKTFNPIKDRKTKGGGRTVCRSIRQANGSIIPKSKIIINEYSQRYNIWEQSPHRQKGGHPAPFPENLANDHILSWSNKGDTVLDPMAGSGTTLKMAKKNNRKYLGIEMSKKYCKMAEKRIDEDILFDVVTYLDSNVTEV